MLRQGEVLAARQAAARLVVLVVAELAGQGPEHKAKGRTDYLGRVPEAEHRKGLLAVAGLQHLAAAA